MQSVLEKDVGFRFQAKGSSMSPFIRNNDIVTVSGFYLKKIEVGDVVAVVNPRTHLLIIHRIVGLKSKEILLKGDNCHAPDDWFNINSVVGLVTKVERNGRAKRYGAGKSKKWIALVSRTRLLNFILLPILRKIKRIVIRNKWKKAK